MLFLRLAAQSRHSFAEREAMDDAREQVSTEALQHLDALYNLARWLVRDPVEAEDLVQETYLRALRAAHQFHPGTNLRAWLFQILRNTFYTQYKRNQREPKAVDPEELERAAHASGAVRAGEGLAGSADGAAGLDLTSALSRLRGAPGRPRGLHHGRDRGDHGLPGGNGEVSALPGARDLEGSLARLRAIGRRWNPWTVLRRANISVI
jgi:RNA polymerase sigma factor (sigma-70 family)